MNINISLCAIVKDAERTIERMLASVQSICVEMIVVDTGSKDKTPLISEALGARVLRFEWNGDFSEARNFALSKARGDWIIILDADEWFAEGSERFIPGFLSKLPAKTDVVKIFMEHVDTDDSGNILSTVGQDILIRIIKNKPNLRFKNKIHECLLNTTTNTKDIKSAFAGNNIKLIHDGYRIADRIKKYERNLHVLLTQGDSIPGRDFYVSRESFFSGKYEQAFEYATKLIQSGFTDEIISISGYVLAFISFMHLKRPLDDIINIESDVCAHFPNHPSTYHIIANIEMARFNYTKAYSFLSQAFELEEDTQNLKEADIARHPLLQVLSNKSMMELSCLMQDDELELKYALEQLKHSTFNLSALERLCVLLRDETDAQLMRIVTENYLSAQGNDLREIISVLAGFEPGYAFLKVYEKCVGDGGLPYIAMLIVIGRYEDAYKVLIQGYKETGIDSYLQKATAVALVGNKEDILNDLFKKGNDSTRRLLNLLCELEGVCPVEQDGDEICKIIAELLNIKNGGHPYALFLIDLSSKLDSHAHVRVINLLLSHGYYGEAEVASRKMLESLIGNSCKIDLKLEVNLNLILSRIAIRSRVLDEAMNYLTVASGCGLDSVELKRQLWAINTVRNLEKL